jgi:hypothetical protein
MAQTCSPCSIPLCGKTVTKTRQELNAEVMVIITTTIMMMMMMIIIITIITTIIIINITVIQS